MYELKTNTAIRIPVGPLVDPTDGKTAETALTVTGLLVEIYQMANDGSAVVRTSFNPSASGGNNDMVHVTNDTAGMYDLELTASNLNWLGNGRITFYDIDGFLVHYIDILVVSAAYFDWKYGTTIPNVNATQISGDATAADNCESFFDGTGYAGTNNVIPTVTTAGLSAAAIDAVWDEVTSGHATAGTTGKALTDVLADLDHATYGLARLVRSTTPANTLTVDANHLVAVPNTQKVDIETIKTQAVTCGAGVTVGVNVGTAQPLGFTGTGASALVKSDMVDIAGAAVNTGTAQVGVNVVTQANIDFGALQKASITSAVPTVGQIQAEIEENGASLLDTIRDQIGTAGAGLTALPWNSAWDAEVQSECADALVAIHLDHLLAEDYDPASKPGTATALLNEIVESDGGVSRFTVNALENAPSGSGASAASIADAVWDEAIADHTTVTTFGGKNQRVVPSETLNDYKATGFSTHSAADVKTAIEANGSSILDTLRDDLADGGRLDLLVDAIKAKTDNLPAAPADDTSIDTQLATIAGYLDTEIAAIKAKTDNLPTDPADESLLIAATDAIMARIGAPAGASVSADVAAVKSETASIVADTNELQGDWTNGGRLDLILDELTTQGDTNQSKIDVVDGIVDTILVDTNELQGLISGSKLPAQVKGIDDIDFGATMKASLETAVDSGMNNAISTPVAGSAAWILHWLAVNVIYKQRIEEADGDTQLYDTNGNALGIVSTRYRTDGTYTWREKGVV